MGRAVPSRRAAEAAAVASAARAPRPGSRGPARSCSRSVGRSPRVLGVSRRTTCVRIAPSLERHTERAPRRPRASRGPARFTSACRLEWSRPSWKVVRCPSRIAPRVCHRARCARSFSFVRSLARSLVRSFVHVRAARRGRDHVRDAGVRPQHHPEGLGPAAHRGRNDVARKDGLLS